MISKEMMDNFQRPLDPSEVEFKIQFAGKSAPADKTRVIPYITARAVQSRLRELGFENYQLKYTPIPKQQLAEGGMICTIGLRTGEGANDFNWYSEVGEIADIEPVKSAASASIKRVANVLGVSDELYRYPIIYINEGSLKSIPSYAYPQLEQLVNDFNNGLITEKFVNIRNPQSITQQSNSSSSTTKPFAPKF